MTLDVFLYIIVYVKNTAVHVLTFFFLPTLLLTCIESILENTNDVLYFIICI